MSSPGNTITADYNGVSVSFTGEGWFNATTAAAKFGKRPVDWLRLAETKRYIKALSAARGISEKSALIRARRNSGTWFHPKLAVRFTQWLDVNFAVWCDEQIDHILRGGFSIWKKSGRARSDGRDREVLMATVAAIVARHGLSYGEVYQDVNLFVGVRHVRDMTCAQVLEAAAFAQRALGGNTTSDDIDRIERNRRQPGKLCQSQYLLLRNVLPGDDGR